MSKFLPFLLLALLGQTVEAGPVLNRVKAAGLVNCGATVRPGVASRTADGHWAGIAIDMCRAVATAVLGSPDKVMFSYYESDTQFARATNGKDDIAFLTGSEIHLHEAAGKVIAGPTIFIATHQLLVPKDSPAQKLSDLVGMRVCMPSGSRAERSVTDWFERHNIVWQPTPYTEQGEMLDGYGAGQCDAIADESTNLVQVLADGVRPSRILPDITATFPLMAVTSTKDGEWAAIVAWTVDTVIAGERRETNWYAGGAAAMPVAAKSLGLDPKWQSRVLTAVGDYGVVYDRHFGEKSGLKLARGSNQNQADGGLLLAPFRE